MAKKKELTMEEKLAAALVREDEWPYEVPGNWVWTRLGGLIQEIKNGTTVKQNKKCLGAKVTRIETIQNNTLDLGRLGYIEDLNTIKDTDWYRDGDIALSHINSAAHVGKTAMITKDLLPLVHGMNLLRIRFNQVCNPQYFQFFSQTFQYKESIIQRINMAVNQVSINQKQLADVEFPLPPLAEQQRIVERIESLFDQLDQAKALIQEALDSFENRKAAILHQAFTGALTKKWREEHGVGLESWEEKPFKECTEFMQNGISKRSGKTGRKVVVLRLANINGNNIDENDLREILLDDKEFDKYKLGYDDILIVRVNGSVDNVGKLVRIVNTGNWAFCDHLIKVRVNYQSILPSFLMYVSMTNEYKDFIKDNMVSSAGQNTISQKSIGELVISLPTLDEQQEIVRILDDLFEKEQDAKDLCDQIDQIDTIKKTILGKAFRGELGTNVAGEESAVELLKEVLQGKEK